MSTYSESAKGFKQGQDATERPAFVLEEHLTFLDDLRESGDTNMLGARPYIEAEYPELTTQQAATILSYWMKTFSQRHRKGSD